MAIEEKPVLLTVAALIVILIGTIVTMVVPYFMTDMMTPHNEENMPYTPLELEGRDIYIREGCNNCHTQTVRPLPDEISRYGDYSKIWEFEYDAPFLWGSKRTGPDLARIGGKYPDSWHIEHMKNPRSIVPDSIMPSYAFLAERPLDTSLTLKKMETLGYPYTEKELMALEGKTELDALIAYLQRLGVSGKPKVVSTAESIIPEGAENPFEDDSQAIAEGKKIYMKRCKSCHGEDGKGKIGPSLVDSFWKYGNSDRDIFISIYDGRPKGMPKWGNKISVDDTWKVAAYIHSIAQESGATEEAAKVKLPEGATNPYAGEKSSIDHGKEVFAVNCAVCHNKDATGKIGPNLRDSEWIYGGSDKDMFETIYNGTPKGMPTWGKKLSDKDIWDVINFIKSLS